MRCAFEYQLKNISNESVYHPVIFHTSEIVGFHPPKDERVGLTRLFIGEDIPEDQFEALDEAADDPVGQRRYRKDMMIDPGETLDVRVSFYQMKKSRDADLWQTLLICENITLTVRFDPDVFNVQMEPVHPADRFDRYDKEDNSVTVTLDRPLLPRNGIFIWWSENQNGDGDPLEGVEEEERTAAVGEDSEQRKAATGTV